MIAWISEQAFFETLFSGQVVTTGMERCNPSPLLILPRSDKAQARLALTQANQWKICKDDSLLVSHGLPPYSTSPFRYLVDPTTTGAKTFLAATDKAPSNSHVQGLERLNSAAGGATMFNPRAGLLRVTRFHPLELEDYLQILEGRPKGGGKSGAWTPPLRLIPNSIYSALESWSARPQGLPFLLHGTGSQSDRFNEIFFLKLSVLRDVFMQVRAYVKAQQLPMLNISPASFCVLSARSGRSVPGTLGGQERSGQTGASLSSQDQVHRTAVFYSPGARGAFPVSARGIGGPIQRHWQRIHSEYNHRK